MGIRKLAQELQLSIGTVSRALNDRPDVHPETRARVKDAAARSGYVPNQSGRSLRSGRTGMTAAVIPAHTETQGCDSGLFAVLESLRRELHPRGQDLVLLLRGQDEDPLGHLQQLVQRRIVDSLVVVQTRTADPRIAFLKAAGVEHVAFGRCAGLDGYSYVDFDFETMATDAARRLVADGHRRLGVVVDGELLNHHALIVAAFQAEVIRLGLPPESVRLVQMSGDGAIPHEQPILSGPRAATGFLATHENLAMLLYRELARCGRKVGEGVSVLCTLPIFAARSLEPALSHYTADLNETGRQLALRLTGRYLDATEGGCVLPTGMLMPLRFVAGRSSVPAAARANV